MTAIVLVMDSFGVGATSDADQFGDAGSDTLGSIARYCQQQQVDFSLPNLAKLGLPQAHLTSTGEAYTECVAPVAGAAFGCAQELSTGKDTPSGHWEMMGTPVLFDWGYFPKTEPCFPTDFIEQLKINTGVEGILGNCHASGTEIIQRLGEEHITTGFPICYTSADSVFQVAAHEEVFGLDRLYQFCQAARELSYELNVGRVIARPFVGQSGEDFARTNNRRDFAIEPPETTLMDLLAAASGEVISIGKIADIFADKGVTQKVKAYGIQGLMDASINALKQTHQGDKPSFIFTNFVDFDQNFGHRRDPLGYAQALMEFDRLLPNFIAEMQGDDLLILTADHGCDPTWPGTEHTREHVPILAFSKASKTTTDLGLRGSFADIGQTLSDYFQLPELAFGRSFINELGIK